MVRKEPNLKNNFPCIHTIQIYYLSFNSEPRFLETKGKKRKENKQVNLLVMGEDSTSILFFEFAFIFPCGKTTEIGKKNKGMCFL